MGNISGIEKEFLKYLHGKLCNSIDLSYWSSRIKQPKALIDRFLLDDLLRYATTIEIINSIYTSTQLKEHLCNKGLKVTGIKAEMAERLFIVLSQDELRVISEQKVFYLTDHGKNIVTEYKNQLKLDADTTWDNCAELIRNNNYKEAYRTMVRYEASRANQRGMGVDWEHEIHVDKSELISTLMNLDYNDIDFPDYTKKEIAVLIALSNMFSKNPRTVVPLLLKITNGIFSCLPIESYLSSIGMDKNNTNLIAEYYIMSKLFSVTTL
jgi:hypothetical protein